MRELSGFALSVLVTGVIVGIASYILANIKAKLNDTSAQNALSKAQEGVSTLADWIPILVVVTVAALVIGYIVRSFKTE